MHFLQKINNIFTCFPNTNYANFHRRGSKGGYPPVKITGEDLRALVRDQASHPRSAAAPHLLKGKISGLVVHTSNKY